MRRHLPSSLWHKGNAESSNPNSLVTVILEFENTGRFESSFNFNRKSCRNDCKKKEGDKKQLCSGHFYFSYISYYNQNRTGLQLTMFSTPGIFKFFWPKDFVENKYSRIYDIPIMDINKRLTKLDPTQHQNFILLHISDLAQAEKTARKIYQISGKEVIVLPDQNSPNNFEAIRKVFPNSLGKMTVNGDDAHPFAKFLRKNCMQTYDYEMHGSKKTIPLGIFHKQGEKITFYSSDQLNNFYFRLQNPK